MRNKIFSMTINVTIGFLSVSSLAFASGAMRTPETSLITQNGFYVAGDVGAADLMTKESHQVNPESHQLGSIGLVGGGYVGYDVGVSNKCRIALEGFGDATGLSTSLEHSSNKYKMDQRYNLGIRILPEYVFTPYTVGHLILGYANGNFHINDNGVYGFVNSSYNLNGFQTGLGVTTVLQNNFFIRLDALYNLYATKTTRGTGLASGNPFQYYTNRFSQVAGEFSLIYKFN